MILIIDNYDSFTYNLVQRIEELGHKTVVYRNDKITLKQITQLNPSHIVISPGPCTPNEAGISNEMIIHFKGKIPILGVCLGHQCIAAAFGGKIIRNTPVHGKEDLIEHDNKTIYKDLKQKFEAGRYHSLIVERESLPDSLEISAWNKENLIMGIRHKEFNIEGIQFHPESIITKEGYTILRNFLR